MGIGLAAIGLGSAIVIGGINMVRSYKEVKELSASVASLRESAAFGEKIESYGKETINNIEAYVKETIRRIETNGEESRERIRENGEKARRKIREVYKKYHM